jgi:hypothetical protein
LRKENQMTKIIVAAAAVGLTLSSAGACEFMRSAQTEVDRTVVASVAVEQEAVQSTAIVLPNTIAPRDSQVSAE